MVVHAVTRGVRAQKKTARATQDAFSEDQRPLFAVEESLTKVIVSPPHAQHHLNTCEPLTHHSKPFLDALISTGQRLSPGIHRSAMADVVPWLTVRAFNLFQVEPMSLAPENPEINFLIINLAPRL